MQTINIGGKRISIANIESWHDNTLCLPSGRVLRVELTAEEIDELIANTLPGSA